MPSYKTQYLKCINCHALSKHQLKYKFNAFKIFTCNTCSNGFLNPIPKNITKYYPENYWKTSGLLGSIKDFLYSFFQSRRQAWVKSYLKNGLILDIGAGEANFAKKLTGFEVISIDFPGSKIKNPTVLKIDFLKWQTQKKFNAIVFWESLEHIPNPGKYLEKSFKLLEPGGLIFIECPFFDSLESNLFGKNWYHLDPPRHLAHFSSKGIKTILKKHNFYPLSVNKVFTPEYMYSGFLVSLLKSLGFDPLNSYLQRKNLLGYTFLSLFLLPFIILSETLLYLFGHAPIMLAVAKKR